MHICKYARNVTYSDFPSNRTLVFFFKYALRKKCTTSVSDNVHWLDLAGKKYSQIQISDTKSALDVLHIFIAFPVFWALYGQLVNIIQLTLRLKTSDRFNFYVSRGFTGITVDISSYVDER